jgi:cytochrome oxidase Cu insertion factor (SCO1/SenC/PrrC family)
MSLSTPSATTSSASAISIVERGRLQALLDELHIKAVRLPPPVRRVVTTRGDVGADYAFDHTSGVLVIDKRGNMRARISHQASGEAIASAVRDVLD